MIGGVLQRLNRRTGCYNLAAMYQAGHGVKANEDEALRWYTYAANQKNVYAISALAAIYHTGKGVEKDPAKALEYYKEAAQMGYLPAEVALAGMYETGEGDSTKGPTEAAIWYARAAKKGNAKAQDRLGYFYENGYGLPSDMTAAIEWYTKAANENAYLPSLRALARLYEQGKGIPMDLSRSANLYRRCANAGEPNCQLQLGRFFKDGTGMEKDPIQAYQWTALAAESFPEGEDKSNAVVARIDISNSLSEDQLTEARRRVDQWKPTPLTPQSF